MQDLTARQRNIVLPDTVQNEARFWRNLGTQPYNALTKIGLAILAVFFWSFAAAFLYAGVGLVGFWKFTFLMALVWGPVFAAIAWGTRRALQAVRRKNHKTH